MTRGEAIKALRLMEHVESIVSTYEPGEIRLDTTVRELKEACRMGAAALRAEQQTNAPLTLEELREMDGEPVWVIVQSYATYGNWRVIRRYIEDHQAFSFYGAGMLSCCDYGKIWTAYRRKPEEV